MPDKPDKKAYLKYFKILEINPDVSFSEVRNSYLHLVELYSGKATAMSVIMDTLESDRQKDILPQLKEAYNKLRELYTSESREKTTSTRDTVSNQRIPEFEVYSGDALRLIREVLGIGLEEVALSTGIPHRHLQSLEKEEYDQLPPAGYIKAFIRKYAEYLFLDRDRVTKDYMRRMETVHQRKNKHSF
jgi:hypothetical protein